MNYTEVIEKLCEKFGTTMEYLVPKAQAYGIWSNVISILISLIIIAMCLKFFKHCKKKVTKEGAWGDVLMDLEDWEGVVGLFAGIALICISIFMLCAISDLVMWITVPEIALIELIR